jgi:hypothetical protein
MNVGVESGAPAKAGMVVVVGMDEERTFVKLILDG